jgi:hypothetical protein
VYKKWIDESMNISSLVHFEVSPALIMYDKNPDRYMYRVDCHSGTGRIREEYGSSASNGYSYYIDGETGDGDTLYSMWQWEVFSGPCQSTAEAAIQLLRQQWNYSK